MRRYSVLIGILTVFGVVAGACGDDGGGGGGEEEEAAECEPVGDLSTATTQVDLTLDEFVVDLATDTAPAGMVGFAVENKGEEAHELVVVQGVAPDELPLADDGSLDEDALPAGALVGEIEPFPAGESCSGVFELAAGEYTLLCNVVEEEDHESHLKEGMVTVLTVT